MRAQGAGQPGQVAVMFALVFALVLTGLVALVGDVVLMYDAAGRLDNGALVGAQAGANQVDPQALREGRVVLDPARALAVCREAASVTAEVPGTEVGCAVSPDAESVTATVTHRVSLAFAVYGPAVSMKRSHTGTIAIGESEGTAP